MQSPLKTSGKISGARSLPISSISTPAGPDPTPRGFAVAVMRLYCKCLFPLMKFPDLFICPFAMSRLSHFFPPRIDPKTPRMICRPSDDPMERTALFAAVCIRPSVLPPRGPVRPKSKSLRPPALCGVAVDGLLAAVG